MQRPAQRVTSIPRPFPRENGDGVTPAEQIERRGGRPRSEDADRAIIAATLELLAEVGIGGLTTEGVANRAGVGKTTVYRRWPNKDALLVDAIATLKGPVPKPPGHSLREDLIAIFEDTGHGGEAGRRRLLYHMFVGELPRHPDLARRFVETVVEPRREVTRAVLRGAVARGELRDDLDLDVMVHMVTAPILQWTGRRPTKKLAPELLRTFLDLSLDGLRPRAC